MFRFKFLPLYQQVSQCCTGCSGPKHMICFKQWTKQMVLDIIVSAINLKRSYRNTHGVRLDILCNSKVMILQEVNEPILSLAVCKAASFLGASHVTVTDDMTWDHDYNGCIFSTMADALFISTHTHNCVQRLADKSSIPVLCMKSRAHASIQALATVMAILEEFGTIRTVNMAYVGPPHPVLNSYLILCPMLGANIRFKCCCKVCPVSPLLLNSSLNMTQSSGTETRACATKEETLSNARVIVSGPEGKNMDKLPEFSIDLDIIQSVSSHMPAKFLYFHTLPRGAEVDDALFYHPNARTFVAFDNLKYIAAALMADAIRGHRFIC